MPLGDGELRARKSRRYLGDGRVALAAMHEDESRSRVAQLCNALGARLGVVGGYPFPLQGQAGRRGAFGALHGGFVESATARTAEQHQYPAGAHRLAPVARTTGPQASA
ncbi:hypothetical protein G6F22_021617 [Rhizopus arrhizus]|nr:hypothetical protein G6F22_021617 [Rhizopus arrhizus]